MITIGEYTTGGLMKDKEICDCGTKMKLERRLVKGKLVDHTRYCPKCKRIYEILQGKKK